MVNVAGPRRTQKQYVRPWQPAQPSAGGNCGGARPGGADDRIRAFCRSRAALGSVPLHDGSRSPATKISVMAVCRGFGFVFSLAMMLLLTRELSQEDYGTLSTALALQSYLGLVAFGGARTIGMGEAARHPARIGPIISAYLRMVCGSALVWWILLCLLMVLNPQWGGQRWLYLLAAGGSLAMVADLQSFFDARGQQVTAPCWVVWEMPVAWLQSCSARFAASKICCCSVRFSASASSSRLHCKPGCCRSAGNEHLAAPARGSGACCGPPCGSR